MGEGWGGAGRCNMLKPMGSSPTINKILHIFAMWSPWQCSEKSCEDCYRCPYQKEQTILTVGTILEYLEFCPKLEVSQGQNGWETSCSQRTGVGKVLFKRSQFFLQFPIEFWVLGPGHHLIQRPISLTGGNTRRHSS